MPTSHRRIGLVVDDDLGQALALFRESSGRSAPEARLAREAVFEGVVLAAFLHDLAQREQGVLILDEFHSFLPSLDVPESVRAVAAEALQQARHGGRRDERRRRQAALLDAPNPHGRAAADLADTFDALDG